MESGMGYAGGSTRIPLRCVRATLADKNLQSKIEGMLLGADYAARNNEPVAE